MTKNIWDNFAEQFNTYKPDLYYGAADNIHTVWPVILEYIKSLSAEKNNLKALDFGCGTGMFCRELKVLGFKIQGMDVSEEMIKIGKENLDKDIRLHVGDTVALKSLANKEGLFDLITAIMVLQFIKDEDLVPLLESINIGGQIVFVNHNPKQLHERGFTNMFYLGGSDIVIPIYQRSVEECDKIFRTFGFERCLEKYVSESQEFLEKYKIQRKTSTPKYMILAYKKSAN